VLIDPAISWTIAISLAVLFVSAASHKLRDPARFREVLRNYRLLTEILVPTAAVLLIALELTAVVLLLVVDTRMAGALLSAGMLAIYAVAMAINLLRGRVNLDCGCLGIGARQPVRWWMVGRNVALAAIALLTVPPMMPRELTALDGVTIACATLSLALLYTAQSLLGAAGVRLRGST
jgi:hypothetical protein